MANTTITHLPTYQRFDCQGCGRCCRDLPVPVADEERRRIEQHDWQAELGRRRLFERFGRSRRFRYRLAHGSEGGCIFLDEGGRCRIHGRHGGRAKPLACQLYPFVLVPTPEGIRVDLRFDCPSVAANKGRPVSAHRAGLAQIAADLGVGLGPQHWPFNGRLRLNFEEARCIAEVFDRLVARGDVSIRGRLGAGCALLDLLFGVDLSKVRGGRLQELLELLVSTVAHPNQQGSSGRVTRPVPPRTDGLFRQWVFLHAISQSPAELGAGTLKRLRGRVRRLRDGGVFRRGRGDVPGLWPDSPRVAFEAVARVKPCVDQNDLEPIIRSLRVKLQALGFAGPAYYGYSILGGLTALWLTVGAAGWLGRLIAAGLGRAHVDADCVAEAMRLVHRAYGQSPAFGRLSERLRIKAFMRPGLPARLLAVHSP